MPRFVSPLFHPRLQRLPPLAVLLLAAAGCDRPAAPPPEPPPEPPAPTRSGAERQEEAMNQVIRALYACEDGVTLTVDFDNRRDMATVRNNHGLAIDLFRQPSNGDLWYRGGGHELRGRNGRASWTAGDRPTTECRATG